eukprot:5937130-Amphidinium_carterae.1
MVTAPHSLLCDVRHDRHCPDGTYEDIACDKETIAPMLRCSFHSLVCKWNTPPSTSPNLFYGLAVDSKQLV